MGDREDSNLETLTDFDVPLTRLPLRYSINAVILRAKYELKRFSRKFYFSNKNSIYIF